MFAINTYNLRGHEKWKLGVQCIENYVIRSDCRSLAVLCSYVTRFPRSTCLGIQNEGKSHFGKITTKSDL